MERLMTTEEVAEVLRIDAVTVRRLIGRGELVAYRTAGEYRVSPADLEKFVESQRVIVDIRPKNQFGDKFTDQARRVLSQASEEARQYNHSGVGTEHLLLALMREDEGIAVKTLAGYRCNQAKCASRLKPCIQQASSRSAPVRSE